VTFRLKDLNWVSLHRKRLLALLCAVFIFLFVSLLLISNNWVSLRTANVAHGATLEWEETYGGNGDDRAFFGLAVSGGYLVVGSSTSNPNSTTKAWSIRLDGSGTELWNKTFSANMGTEFRYAISLEDGFLLVGNTFLANGREAGYVVKIDSEGSLLWKVVLGDVDGINKLFSASNCSDGFILTGLTTGIGWKGSDLWLVKLDLIGNVIWEKTCGGDADQAGRSVTITEDGCIMVTGYSDQLGDGNYDFLVVKTGMSGNIIWKRCFGGNESDKAYSICSTSNGTVIAGDTRSKGAGDSDAWVIKIDLDGNIVWEKTVGGTGFDTPSYLTVWQDGFLVCGTTFSFGNGNRDFWSFSLSNSGKELWSATIGRLGYEEAYVSIPISKSALLLAGWTNSIGNGRYDFYVVQLKIKN
jgi:hypothetical protein